MSYKDVRAILGGTSGSDELTVDIRALIEFFDVNTEATQDASSIKAILGEELAFACMRRYFESQGAKARLLTQYAGDDRRLACTTGKQKGYQLDGWFVVEKDGATQCYQTEIKSWSFHGIGDKHQRLLITDEDDDCIEQKRKIFNRYYDAGAQCLLHPGTSKVLLEMRQPQAPRRQPPYPTHNPKPLLCLWAPVCTANAARSEVFFSVPVARIEPLPKENGALCASGGFTEVHVFSVSNYLREALASPAASTGPLTISLPLPRIAQRLRLLAAIFS